MSLLACFLYRFVDGLRSCHADLVVGAVARAERRALGLQGLVSAPLGDLSLTDPGRFLGISCYCVSV